MIGSPLGTKLMMFYRASAHPIAATWGTMGLLYFVFMMFGVFTIRVPREGWKPEGWVPRATRSALISAHSVEVNTASLTRQFWLLFVVTLLPTASLPAEDLWVAKPFTPEGAFTPGIEGPNCDAAGNLFAVNYAREGTIGRVTPDGKAEVFVVGGK